MFQILEIAIIKIEKENKLLPQLELGLPDDIYGSYSVFRIIWILIKYLSDHNLKNTGRKVKFGYVKNYAVWMGNFFCKSCSLRDEKNIRIEYSSL